MVRSASLAAAVALGLAAGPAQAGARADGIGRTADECAEKRAQEAEHRAAIKPIATARPKAKRRYILM